MGLFDKKYCDICGQKIGLLGNRKLEDGNMCKDCARLLSPFMTDRRQSTVEEIKRHLQYRAENQNVVHIIQPTRIMGNSTKVYIDEPNDRFFVTRQNNWRDSNPDIVQLAQVIGCETKIEENKKELYQPSQDGKDVPYTPPRYECAYQFDFTIRINSPYFDEISFELSDERPDSPYTDAYRSLERQADELTRALQSGTTQPTPCTPITGRATTPDGDSAWVCSCGATNTGRFCGACGAKKLILPTSCPQCGWASDNPALPPKFCQNCGARFDSE